MTANGLAAVCLILGVLLFLTARAPYAQAGFVLAISAVAAFYFYEGRSDRRHDR